jgi:hypothetical protein
MTILRAPTLPAGNRALALNQCSLLPAGRAARCRCNCRQDGKQGVTRARADRQGTLFSAAGVCVCNRRISNHGHVQPGGVAAVEAGHLFQSGPTILGTGSAREAGNTAARAAGDAARAAARNDLVAALRAA